jgi:4a-hydroxytetrahydrobiopterin dehydratase
MKNTRMSEAEVAGLAGELPGWTVETSAIRRQFKFADFSAAWAFMSRVALLAEKHDHHPDWSNSYNTVDIALSSHDAGGITARDAAMARAIDLLG